MSAARSPILIGANPGVQLYDGETLTAYVSAWRVDWSPHGAGTAVVVWRDDVVHVYGADVDLATWLERDFVRHFPEADGLVWPEPIVRRQLVEVRIDLATGFEASSDALDVRAQGVLDRRTFATDDFVLGGVSHSLSLVLAPCGDAAVTHEGQRVAGRPRAGGTVDRPSSSAFVAEAEVWSR